MATDVKLTLKMARELKHYTQQQAAEKIGINIATLSNYERGKSYPDVPTLRKIEEVYEVEYSRIIFLPLDYDKIVNRI